MAYVELVGNNLPSLPDFPKVDEEGLHYLVYDTGKDEEDEADSDSEWEEDEEPDSDDEEEVEEKDSDKKKGV